MNKIFSIIGGFLVLVLAVSPLYAVSTDLIARWNLNEISEGQVVDSTDNKNNGTVFDAQIVSGRYGNALDFSNGGYVQVPNDQTLEPAAVSVEAWVKASGSPGTYQYILSKGAQTCNNASYALYTGENGGLAFYVSSSDGTFVISPNAGTGVWDNKWHYVAGTYDGANVRLYVDGKEVGSGTPATFAIGYNLPNGNDLYLGRYEGSCSYGFTGSVDEVRVWDVALSGNEITKHAKSNSL